MKTAKLFYANVVGWGARDASAPGLGYSLFTVADLPVAGLMNMPQDGQKTGAPLHWIGYVGVDDVDSSGQAIELARDAGQYFDRVFGDLPVNVVGVLGADWLREVRIRN